MIYQLRRSLALSTTLSEAWKFFSDPKNLLTITPPHLGFEILTHPIEAMYPGQSLVYRVRPLLGIAQKWVTEITHVREPRLFVDEQRFGPYRMWHHQHKFSEIPGGVLAEDIVDYIMPFGPLGVLVHELIVRKQLQSIFDFREKILHERFGVIAHNA